MSDLTSRARPAVDELVDFDEDKLYGELGARLQAIARAPEGSGQFDMKLTEPLEAYGVPDELKSLGRKFFLRWKREAFNLMCGSAPDDAAAREQISGAFSLGREALTATLAAALASYLGLAAGLAAVVAMLAYKLFFRPSYDATCDYWKEKL